MKSNYMEPAFFWEDRNTTDWEEALSLPALPWARPLLPLMGLPSTMVEQPAVWESIHTQALSSYQTRLQTQDWEVGIPGGRSRLVQQIFTFAFGQLAAQLGQETAINFERWVLMHFFWKKKQYNSGEYTFSMAMNRWDTVLNSAYFTIDTRHRRLVSPPETLVTLRSEIAELVSHERRREIIVLVENIAPPPPKAQIPDEQLKYCYEATLIKSVIQQSLTLKALRIIAENLNEEELNEVVEWAQQQLLAISKGLNPDELCGNKYLLPELPCLGMPLVLSMNVQYP